MKVNSEVPVYEIVIEILKQIGVNEAFMSTYLDISESRTGYYTRLLPD